MTPARETVLREGFLKSSTKQELNENDPKWVCASCGALIKSYGEIENHVNRHLPEELTDAISYPSERFVTAHLNGWLRNKVTIYTGV